MLQMNLEPALSMAAAVEPTLSIDDATVDSAMPTSLVD